jgi:serine/threonine-protein kinase
MASIELSQELLDHFNISEYKQANPGGQKTVFIVTIDGLKYALKIINIADDRFEREVKICEQFNQNKGIPTIKKIEKYDEDTIILEEYIDGNDLSDLIKEYKGDAKKVCKLIHSVGTILKPVWDARYIHRDLKPQNIRIRENGELVVLDFGIARALDEESITATGGQPLSWLFASPEQYAGQKQFISYRTDFFCLGIIAYHLYTNELPFGNNKNEIDASFQKKTLSVSTSNELIDTFCNTVLKKNPSERPRKIESFLKLIEL